MSFSTVVGRLTSSVVDPQQNYRRVEMTGVGHSSRSIRQKIYRQTRQMRQVGSLTVGPSSTIVEKGLNDIPEEFTGRMQIKNGERYVVVLIIFLRLDQEKIETIFSSSTTEDSISSLRNYTRYFRVYQNGTIEK